MIEKYIKIAMTSVVLGFIITLFTGIFFISITGSSSYISEGGVPLTWNMKDLWGFTHYDYTGFILDLIFWSFFIFLIPLAIKKSKPIRKPETLQEKRQTLIDRMQEEREVEILKKQADEWVKNKKKK